MIVELDARRLLCPMPVIRLQNKIPQLSPGVLVHVFCTDPGTLHDIPTWCRMFGHCIISIEEKEGEILFIIQVT